MSYIDLTTTNFNETMDNKEIVFIDFWAEWCGPCKKFAPIFEKAAASNPDICFTKVNTDEQQAIAKYYAVYSVPTVIGIRDGIIVINQEGMLSEAGMDDLIKHVKSIDMDKVREELESEEG
ncbi:MAG: thioredoxin [Campylobacterota bacterium]